MVPASTVRWMTSSSAPGRPGTSMLSAEEPGWMLRSRRWRARRRQSAQAWPRLLHYQHVFVAIEPPGVPRPGRALGWRGGVVEWVTRAL